jgi:hypothetical protein
MCAGVLLMYVLVFSTGLTWGVPPGGGYRGQGGILLFVGDFGG